ncbi:hypothetical protein GYMLUDRAFT_245999 [Collybiopsis luxurians FD-317 M1]|uniref:Uncharacterized protein n=1 Tax=Collybiopsis luxurians FD-317 M1 TaxID=944289 RepID=A0A0D0B5I0_9AGAR|nr:hypothetical protein GYMLUDRAFT_245999 [Collybiopsis luxurians FD-317 M1]
MNAAFVNSSESTPTQYYKYGQRRNQPQDGNKHISNPEIEHGNIGDAARGLYIILDLMVQYGANNEVRSKADVVGSKKRRQKEKEETIHDMQKLHHVNERLIGLIEVEIGLIIRIWDKRADRKRISMPMPPNNWSATKALRVTSSTIEAIFSVL